jgi:hypothetical protein
VLLAEQVEVVPEALFGFFGGQPQFPIAAVRNPRCSFERTDPRFIRIIGRQRGVGFSESRVRQHSFRRRRRAESGGRTQPELLAVEVLLISRALDSFDVSPRPGIDHDDLAAVLMRAQ